MTLTANIHLGIAGWSNATYTAGQRRSNAGNAYQVVTGGTSTSPPTGTGSSINNGGTAVWKYLSAVDYTTMQAHANALASTPGQPVLGLLWFSGDEITTTAGAYLLQLTGHTTSNVNTITYRPAAGESFKDFYVSNPTAAYQYNNANGVCFKLPASGAGNINYFQIDDQWVILDGIQFRDPNASSASSIIGGTGANLTIQNCIIDGYAQSGGARILNPSGANLTFDNNLVVGRNTSAGSAILSTSGGSGAIVVNNTFVHTTLVGGQVVLDSGSNTTNASCTSTNNVFLNYGVAYAATSGTPWVSDHCAYSMASFGTQNGTDAGGSVYGITSGAAFVGFSTNMNPKSGGPLINAGTTGANVPGTDAFGNTRPQGASPDIGAVELLAVSATVTRDMVAAIEILETLPHFGGPFSAADPVFPIAWQSTIAKNSGKAIEWRGSFVRDARFQFEQLATAPQLYDPFSAVFTSDWGIAAGYSIYPIFPIEWGSISGPSVTRDASFPIGWGASKARDVRLELEQLATNPRISSPFTGEFTSEVGEGPYSLDPVFVLDWQAPAGFSVFMTAPVEWRATLNASVSFPVAPNATGARDAILPVEWRASTAGIFSTLVAPIEWRAPVGANATASIAWMATVVGPPTVAPMEWRSTILTGLGASVEWRAPVVADTTISLAMLGDVQSAAIFPIAAQQSVRTDAMTDIFVLATRDQKITAPIEWGSGWTLSVTLPVEWAQGASIAAATMPVEWRMGVHADATMPVATGATIGRDAVLSLAIGAVAATSAVLPLEIGRTAVVSASMPVEFGHLLITRQVDVILALEIAATVSSDFVAAMELRHVRHDLGSQLEPDRWERDHEP